MKLPAWVKKHGWLIGGAVVAYILFFKKGATVTNPNRPYAKR